MNPEIKGKAAVALVISLIAFGFGTGASIFTDFSFYKPQNTNFSIKEPGDLPVVYNVKNSSNTNTTTNSPPIEQTSNSQDVYEEPTTTPNNNQNTGNQTSNQNTTP